MAEKRELLAPGRHVKAGSAAAAPTASRPMVAIASGSLLNLSLIPGFIAMMQRGASHLSAVRSGREQESDCVEAGPLVDNQDRKKRRVEVVMRKSQMGFPMKKASGPT